MHSWHTAIFVDFEILKFAPLSLWSAHQLLSHFGYFTHTHLPSKEYAPSLQRVRAPQTGQLTQNVPGPYATTGRERAASQMMLMRSCIPHIPYIPDVQKFQVTLRMFINCFMKSVFQISFKFFLICRTNCYTHYRQKCRIVYRAQFFPQTLQTLWHIVYAYHLESAFLAFFVGKWQKTTARVNENSD